MPETGGSLTSDFQAEPLPLLWFSPFVQVPYQESMLWDHLLPSPILLVQNKSFHCDVSMHAYNRLLIILVSSVTLSYPPNLPSLNFPFLQIFHMGFIMTFP
jgi:hypothetical protein